MTQAEGIIQLVITRSNTLPPGWEEKTEGGAMFWVHGETATKSYSHPAAIAHDAFDNPIKVSVT